MTPEQRRKILEAYVLDRLTKETNSARGAKASVARAAGITTAHITNLTKNQRNPGPDSIAKLAFYWGFASYGAIEEEAVRLYTEQYGKEPFEPPVERYANRARAEAAAIALGYAREDVRRWADAVGVSLDADEDPDAETWWLPRILSERARQRSLAKSLKSPTEPAGRPLDVSPSPHKKRR